MTDKMDILAQWSREHYECTHIDHYPEATGVGAQSLSTIATMAANAKKHYADNTGLLLEAIDAISEYANQALVMVVWWKQLHKDSCAYCGRPLDNGESHLHGGQPNPDDTTWPEIET